MSKTIKKSFDEKLNFINFIKARERASLNKKDKKEIALFEMDLETNITNILTSIQNNSYSLGKYREFKIFEPKERIIKSLPYKDRIVHQWYIEEFIKPYILPRFIKDSYACIDQRGTHSATKVVQKYMRIMKRKYGNYYVLKCDIKKYFYSIDRNILFSILNKYITDRKLLTFTRKLIFDTPELVGIPIGNYTSQYFANIYLNELDKYVKNELKIKYYVRYMDDFVLLASSKVEARYLKDKISFFLCDKLNLQLNQKTSYYPSALGINFCGYIIYETHILLRKRSIKKIKTNINNWNNLYKANNLNLSKVLMQWNSWKAHANHANTFYLQKKINSKIIFKSE